jgi:hypothetical protein
LVLWQSAVHEMAMMLRKPKLADFDATAASARL